MGAEQSGPDPGSETRMCGLHPLEPGKRQGFKKARPDMVWGLKSANIRTYEPGKEEEGGPGVERIL